MASFVREVLSATGHLGEKDDLAAKIHRLSSRIDELKSGLGSKISSRYDDFNCSFVEVSTSVDQLESVICESEALENTVNHMVRPGLQEASKDVQEVLSQLGQLSETVQNANLIKNSYADMEKINEMIDRRRYVDAAGLLKNLEDRICFQTKTQDEATRKALAAIGTELRTAADSIHYALGKDWDQHVEIGSGNEKEETVNFKVDFRDTAGCISDDRIRQLVEGDERF